MSLIEPLCTVRFLPGSTVRAPLDWIYNDNLYVLLRQGASLPKAKQQRDPTPSSRIVRSEVNVENHASQGLCMWAQSLPTDL